MMYEGKIINKATIAYLKGLLSEQTLLDPLAVESTEEKEIISAIRILSYAKINTDEEEASYEKKSERTIGGISFAGTNKEILEQATQVRDCLKHNPLVKMDSAIASKTLYKENDTFELTLKDGEVLTFKKPIIVESINPSDIASTEAYLKSFYEKYNKEALQKYYKSRKYKGKTPRIPYPHELFVFTNGEAKIRKSTEPCTYYEKVVELTSVKKDRKKAKHFFQKRKELALAKKDTENKKEESNVTTKRHKVINRVPGKEFFKKIKDYFVKEGEEEEWKQAWNSIVPFAIAGVFLSVFKFTPFGDAILKGLVSCIKFVPKAFINASKLIPYFRGQLLLSSAMLSACTFNLIMLISLAGVGVFTCVAIKKRLKKIKEKTVQESLQKESETKEPEDPKKTEEPMPPLLPDLEQAEKNKRESTINIGNLSGCMLRMNEVKTQIKECEFLQENLDDPIAAQNNLEVFFNTLLTQENEKLAEGLVDEPTYNKNVAVLTNAKNDGTLLNQHNNEIRKRLDERIAKLKYKLDLLLEQYDIIHFGSSAQMTAGKGKTI